jgi:hypothetical protein
VAIKAAHAEAQAARVASNQEARKKRLAQAAINKKKRYNNAKARGRATQAQMIEARAAENAAKAADAAKAALTGPPANAKTRKLAALKWIQSAWPLSGQEGNPISGYRGWKKSNLNIFKVIGDPKNMNFYNVNAAVAGKNWTPPRNGLGGGLVRNWQKRKQRILNLATHYSRRKT